MLSSRAIALAAGCATAVALGGCSGSAPEAAADRVIGHVGASVVTEQQVLDRLGVPENGGLVTVVGASENPWELAVQTVVRDELLRLGAVEAGLARAGDERAVQVRAAIDHEVSRTPALRAESVTQAEAREWFAGHSGDFAHVESAAVSWAQFSDAATASAALPELADPKAAFESTAQRHAALRSGTATLDHQGSGADLSVARITFAVTCDGRAGMVADPDGRTWWVVRTDAAVCQPPEWTTQLAQVVGAAVAWDRLQSALRGRAAEYQRTWPVRMADGWQVPASGTQAG